MDTLFKTTQNSHGQNLQGVSTPKQTWETPTLCIANTQETSSGGLSSFFENDNYYPLTVDVS